MPKIIFSFFFLFLISCNAYKDIAVSELSDGMSVEEVQSIVKKKMIRVSMSSIDGDNKEVYTVQKRIVRGGIARQQVYKIQFINGKMESYEKESENFSF